jgi:hypothetical protein
VSHLTPAEAHIEFDLVAGHQEAASLIRLDRDVVVVGLRHQTDLFQLGLFLILACFTLFFTLLIAKLAVIEQATDRRIGVGRYFDQIETTLFSNHERFARCNDSDLNAGIVNQAYFTCPNTVIDAKPIPDGFPPLFNDTA